MKLNGKEWQGRSPLLTIGLGWYSYTKEFAPSKGANSFPVSVPFQALGAHYSKWNIDYLIPSIPSPFSYV